jgi:hypothetical protein
VLGQSLVQVVGTIVSFICMQSESSDRRSTILQACGIFRHLRGAVNVRLARLTIVILRAPQNSHEPLHF